MSIFSWRCGVKLLAATILFSLATASFTASTFAQSWYAQAPMHASVPPIIDAQHLQFNGEQSIPMVDDNFVSETGIDQLYGVETEYPIESYSGIESNRERVWFGAVDVSFLRPNVNLPRSSVFIFDGLGSSITAETDGAELDDFYSAPRLTLGTRKNGNAILFRYWNLNINETDYFDSPNLPSPASIIGLAHDQIGLDFTTIDFELEKQLCCKCINSSISLGTRYVEFDSFALATATDLLQGETASITGFTQQNYKGMGIVTGWNGELPIRNSGWSLAWGGRASAIFGTHFQRNVLSGGLGSQTAYASSAVRNSSSSTSTDTLGSGARAFANATPADDATLWIFEGQLRLKYSREFSRATGFFSFGIEYQYWDLPDATTDSRIAINLPLRVPESMSNGLGLTGFNISTGLAY